MQILVVYAHPNPASFNHALTESSVEVAKSLGHTVKVLDLYKEGFSPVLTGQDLGRIAEGNTPDDIRAQQELVSWADLILFSYPIWWTGMPAILKGWIDRTLTYGYAYVAENGQIKGLLGDKRVIVVNTTGTPTSYYDQSGMSDAMRKTSDEGIFQFCGMKVLDHIFYGAVPSVEDEVRNGYLEDFRKRVAAMLEG